MIKSIEPLFYANKSIAEIANIIGSSQATVSRQCKKHGLKRKPIWAVASDGDIIKLSQCGLSCYEIAAQLGVSHQTIHERQCNLNINRSLQSCTEEIADKVRKHHVDLSHFQVPDRIGSYWLGVLFADGSVFGKPKPYRISIGLAKKDKQWLEQYAADIGLKSSYNISEYTNKHGHQSVRVALSNMHFAKLLWAYGLDPRHNYKVILPPVILNDFVRGVLDGDGYCRYKKGRRSKKTGQRGHKFLDVGIYFEHRDLADRLLKPIEQQCGVLLNGPYKTKGIWVIKASHQKALQFAEWLWDDPIRYLARKHKTARTT